MTATRAWWRGAVLYQIYPRSFVDSNGDGIGDLEGVRRKLDYVVALGVDGVWLSPFFASPMRDFGYDVSDYRAVDPMFGSLQDFDSLVAEAHTRGLKVIIDQVYSHSSSDHPWFAASRQDAVNDKADWYVWANPTPAGAPPNNWQAWFGGAAWTWEPRRRQYYLHNFLPTQPDLNFRNPKVQEAILDIARFWLDRGVDGFRLDVANYYVHDAQLRDNPSSGHAQPALPRDMQIHQFNANQPETLDFLAQLRTVLDGYRERMTVGELAPGSLGLMQAYTRGARGLHTAYAFDFLGTLPSVERIAAILSAWGEGAEDGWPSWALSNHDVARVATRWGEAIGAPTQTAAQLFLAFLLALRGTIFLYQGEELGLPEAMVPFERLKDPWGIAGWPTTRGRDGCRTPMPWDRSSMAGFTTAHEAWLPIDPHQRVLAEAAQELDPSSCLKQARDLIALRRSRPALQVGGFKVETARGELLAFTRAADETIYCAFNFGKGSAELDAPEGAAIWSHGAALDGRRLRLEPFGAAWISSAAASPQARSGQAAKGVVLPDGSR